MSSKLRSRERLLDLDLPTTQEDIEALHRARRENPLSLAATLRILSKLQLSGPQDSPRPLATGWEPFDLD